MRSPIPPARRCCCLAARTGCPLPEIGSPPLEGCRPRSWRHQPPPATAAALLDAFSKTRLAPWRFNSLLLSEHGIGGLLAQMHRGLIYADAQLSPKGRLESGMHISNVPCWRRPCAAASSAVTRPSPPPPSHALLSTPELMYYSGCSTCHFVHLSCPGASVCRVLQRRMQQQAAVAIQGPSIRLCLLAFHGKAATKIERCRRRIDGLHMDCKAAGCKVGRGSRPGDETGS